MRALATVSYPARKMVRTSSRTCSSDMPVCWPVSSACSSRAGEEHGEEVAFVGSPCALLVFGDEAVDYGVEAGFGSAEFDEPGMGRWRKDSMRGKATRKL